MVNVLPQIQRQPSFKEQLGSSLGGGISQGLSKSFEMMATKAKEKKLINKFKQAGFNENESELFVELSKGGQTALAKDILESRKRGTNSLSKNSENDESDDKKMIEEQDIGLTPSEKVKRQSERFKTGLPVYQEANTKLRGFSRDKERLKVLDSLNKSNKLPTNLGRLNVDQEGNLRIPFLASAEAQRYVKTLNEFSSGAKDTFGSRVTNFDLSQFLKRFPTLLNTKEGRKQLTEQMNIVNDINSVYYKNLKKVFEESGGVRRIDTDIAEGLAEKRSEKEVENLIQKFDIVGQFTSLPSASENKGKKIRNPATGEILQSNGSEWIPENLEE